MLNVTGLSKSYGKKPALHDVNFSIQSGEVVGFLGTNGAGKSTTMNIITGYISASGGTVTVDGFDILQEPEKAKKRIGYLPEVPPLYQDLTVWESLCFTYELKKVKLDKKAHLNEISQLVKIDDVRNRLVQNLSKGYRQRVGIANALVGNPPILILDEPTVGLDPKQIIEIRNLIGNLAKDRTVVLSSHILQEIEAVCGRIIIINEGTIIADDTPENLVSAYKEDYNVIAVAKGDKESMTSVLQCVDGVTSVRCDNAENDEISKFYINAATDDARGEIARALVTSGAQLMEMRHNQPSLEQIFIRLTSPAITEPEAEEPSEQSAHIQEGDDSDASHLQA